MQCNTRHQNGGQIRLPHDYHAKVQIKVQRFEQTVGQQFLVDLFGSFQCDRFHAEDDQSRRQCSPKTERQTPLNVNLGEDGEEEDDEL